MDDDKIHPIRIVARRTGLSTHAIRIWERRYQAVEPARTDTNRRLYSEADIERLNLLHQATRAGHSISQIANLPTEDLDKLISRDAPRTVGALAPTYRSSAPQEAATYIGQALAAVDNMDAKGLEAALFRAEVDLGRHKLLAQVVGPLMQQIGDKWINCDLRIADEHMATAVVRSFLGTLQSASTPDDNAPVIVIATPIGQWHEIGALLASLTATAGGWRVIYLGPNLPAEEIASVALQHQARAVGLSIIYCGDGDQHLSAELSKLRRALGDQQIILIGGRAASLHSGALDDIEAEHLPTLAEFSARLGSLSIIAPA